MQYEYHTLHDYYTLYDQRQLVPGERFIRKRQAKIRRSCTKPVAPTFSVAPSCTVMPPNEVTSPEDKVCWSTSVSYASTETLFRRGVEASTVTTEENGFPHRQAPDTRPLVFQPSSASHRSNCQSRPARYW